MRFDGVVSVLVPDGLDETDAWILARAVAMATILATVENPDCGECLEAACEEFERDTELGEEVFDQAEAVSASGDWTVMDGAPGAS